MFPGAPAEALDLLKKLLIFNPYFRLTVEEALAHPFFHGVRKDDIPMPTGEIVMEWEQIVKEDDSKETLMELFEEEMARYRIISTEDAVGKSAEN